MGQDVWRQRIRQNGVATAAAVGLLVGATATTASAAPAEAASSVVTQFISGANDPNISAPVPSDDSLPGAIVAPDTLVPLGSRIGPAAAAPKPVTGTPLTFKVYATREGLVGHTTANGHKVVPGDHFVSLPNTNVLSPKGKSYYSVRVCTVSNSRCEYEPVWDVGPWNTHDDYWNLKRTSWTMLPSGVPESQAAYQDGYNGGKDQFGRRVRNPAGIDLADGVAGDGLGIGGSGWVNVTYLWTGGGIHGQVSTNGGVLNVRSGASTANKIVGLAGPYAQIPIECQLQGEQITRKGTATTSTWYRVGKTNYVSAAYTKPQTPTTTIPAC
jgi:hypothetical protein